MSIFKRLSTTLVSRLDKVVGEIENHDAVIQVTLNEMRKKVAEAKVRLDQVRNEEQQLKQQILTQKENITLWQKRAVECAKTDEAKALECVSRSRQCQQKINSLERSLAQYTQTADKLARDIETSEQRLIKMKQKLTLMRARQSTSCALEATNEINSHSETLLDESFDRWEINISQTEMSTAEMSTDSCEKIDLLERDFIAQEQQEELQKELEILLAAEELK